MRKFSISELKEIVEAFNGIKKDVQYRASQKEKNIVKGFLIAQVGISGILSFYNSSLAGLVTFAGVTLFIFTFLINLGENFLEKSLFKKINFKEYESHIHKILAQEDSQKAILSYIIDSYNNKNTYLNLAMINQLKLYLINKNYNNALISISNIFYCIENYEKEQCILKSYDHKLGLSKLDQEQELELEGNIKWSKLL